MSRPPKPPRIYALADAEALAPMPLSEGVERLAAGGCRWIQLRAKRLDDRRFWAQAERTVLRLEGSDVALWINDRADFASALGVEGLHLGQDDLPPRAGREIVGERLWIGASTHTPVQVARAADDPAVDLVAVGPVFSTRGKRDADPVVGLDLVRRARERSDKPLVAIGGIDATRVEAVLAAGADSVALLGAVCSGSIERNLARLAEWL